MGRPVHLPDDLLPSLPLALHAEQQRMVIRRFETAEPDQIGHGLDHEVVSSVEEIGRQMKRQLLNAHYTRGRALQTCWLRDTH